jgi:hypothetical protein
MSRDAEDRSRLDRLVENVRADPASFPLAELRPVLIPSPILEGGDWLGPHVHFPGLPVSLTWARLREPGSFLYLTTAEAQAMTAKGIDWRQAARDTIVDDFLREPWTHEFSDRDDNLEGVILAQTDGLGPSRLFCHEALLEQFPEGFEWFVPDRWAALIVLPGATPEGREHVLKMVASLHEKSSVPMSLEPYDHSALRDALVSAGEYVTLASE